MKNLSKLLLACGTLVVAFGCQPRTPNVPQRPPVAPPQAYESEGCTDPDECSEGAMIEIFHDDEPTTAEAAPASAEAPVSEALSPELSVPEVQDESAQNDAFVEILNDVATAEVVSSEQE